MKMKKIFTHISIFSIFFAACVFVTGMHSPVEAQVTNIWTGAGSVCVGTGNASDVATIQGLQCLLANILGIAVSGIGLIGFVMIIVGAFTFLLSGGQAKGTEGGRKTLTFAVAGLVLALSAYIILNLIANFTGVDKILNFHIPDSNQGLK